MAVRAVADVISFVVDRNQSPMVCTPVIAVWFPESSHVEEMTNYSFPAGTSALTANTAIKAAVRALLEDDFDVTFGLLDTVLLARGVEVL